MCHIFNKIFRGGKKKQNIGPEAFDGTEKRIEPLSCVNITCYVCSLSELKTAKYTHIIAHELGVPEEIVDRDLRSYLSGIPDEVTCILEYPYIEEYYRDTYYSFYARKHHDYNRHCFRVSFFNSDVSEENIFDKNIKEKFWGYVVLRPTPRRIIGYSFIHPSLYNQSNEVSICICKRLISVLGQNLETVGFPFLSHDGEVISCAENSILMIFDYFSRRYNNYARVLPSQIFSYSNNLYRKQPSSGLSKDNVTYIINNLGMTTRTYTRNNEDPSEDNYEFPNNDFNKLLLIFVESGMPVYVETSEHAFLIIGRESKLFEQGAKCVVMDGNQRPYHLLDNTKDISSFIVPTPDNILLDAHLVNPVDFLHSFKNEYPNVEIFDDRISYYHRIFLTTSRSFKKHIANSKMSHDDKMLIVCTSMPKFIWICESLNSNELIKETKDVIVDVLAIYDATDYPTKSNHLLLLKTKNKLAVPTTDSSKLRRKKYSIVECNYRLHTFQYNLKGIHTEWKG